MKEDKENARPREKKVEIKCKENEKTEKANKEKKEAMTKVANVSVYIIAYSYITSSSLRTAESCTTK